MTNQQQTENRDLVEKTVEEYISNELRDFEGCRESLRQVNPELNKVEIIKHRMKEYLQNRSAKVYFMDLAYADSYIEERATTFVNILDPSYIRKNYNARMPIITRSDVLMAFQPRKVM